MNTTLLRRRSWAALAVAGLALTATLGGIATTAHAAPTAKAKPAKGCPLTDAEKSNPSGDGWIDRSALDFYPGTLYTAPGIPLEVSTQKAAFGHLPIGKLTVATKRSPRTVVNFCADQYGRIQVVFPADTITGPATLTMSSRKKMWQGPGLPMKKDVFQKKFGIVALDAVPEKPVSPTEVRAEVRSNGLFFTWAPLSAKPEVEFYRFSCTLNTAVKPELLVPWAEMNLHMQADGIFPLVIQSINPAGWTEAHTGWRYDPERRTVTRVY